MQPGSDIIISDTSCLIILNKIDELELLKKVGKKVYVTPIIQKEFGKSLPDWIVISLPNNTHYQQILEMDLDKGEASAIALSLDMDNPVVSMPVAAVTKSFLLFAIFNLAGSEVHIIRHGCYT